MFHAVLWAGKESDLLDLIDMSNFAKPENALKRAEGKWQILFCVCYVVVPCFGIISLNDGSLSWSVTALLGTIGKCSKSKEQDYLWYVLWCNSWDVIFPLSSFIYLRTGQGGIQIRFWGYGYLGFWRIRVRDWSEKSW